MASASDNFNRADAALAAPWVKVQGNTLSVVSNTLQGGAGSDTFYYYTGAASGSDQFAQATLAATTNDDWGPAVRVKANGANGDGYFYDSTSGGGLCKEIAGAFTLLVSHADSKTVGAVRRVEASGTTIKGFWNGTQTTSTTDSSLTGGGQPGVFAFLMQSADDWSGGDLGGGTTDVIAFAATGSSTPGFALAGMTDTITVASSGHSTPSFGTSGTDTVTVAATGHSAPSFGVSGTDVLSVSTLGRSAPAFGTSGVDQTVLAASGHSAPSFTVTRAGVDQVTLATTGHASPAFTLAAMTDVLAVSTAGRSAPSFTVTGSSAVPTPSGYDQTPVFIHTHSL